LNIDQSGAGTFRSCKVGKFLLIIKLLAEIFVTFLQTRTRGSPWGGNNYSQQPFMPNLYPPPEVVHQPSILLQQEAFHLPASPLLTPSSKKRALPNGNAPWQKPVLSSP
jgi:hypothetical protein